MIKVKVKKEHLEKAKQYLKDINNDWYPELSDAFQENNPIALALKDNAKKVISGLSSVVIDGDCYAIKDEPEKDGEEGPVSKALKNWIKTGNWNLNKEVEILPRWIRR